MNRRNFLYRGTGLIAGSMLLNFTPAKLFAGPGQADMVKIKSTDYYKATFRAIHELGGIHRFVPSGSHVGFLINSAFDEPGAFVNPDISLAMLFLCWEAGASEITMLQPVSETYWRRSTHFGQHRFLINQLKQVAGNEFPAVFNEDEFEVKATINGASVLQNVEIIKKIREVDVFINVPILKHHATSILTGALKNMMGLNTRKTNVTFHLGSGKRNDPEYLAQCIADLNLVRKPDLVVADATEFITGNGPSGPGPIRKLDLVVASADPVAIDAFGANCLDMSPSDILTVTRAYDHGLGEMDLAKLSVLECSID